ncbi:unnamed protein product [Closterium sp. NIES-53]
MIPLRKAVVMSIYLILHPQFAAVANDTLGVVPFPTGANISSKSFPFPHAQAGVGNMVQRLFAAAAAATASAAAPPQVLPHPQSPQRSPP